ncbi:MAG: hydratase [Clostridia bacterium]|nr:hydratase [Clostridia bacterium]
MQYISDGVFWLDGKLVPAASCDRDRAEGAKGTIAHSILMAHNTSGDQKKLKIKFDAMASHDITYVGIIQSARASGLTEFPMPYVLTNCHNSLCAVGGTINEDDHVFGLSAAKKYGGIYVPAHQSVIHAFMRETQSGCGRMILGSDSHTRYGALGTMAIGEGGPELCKQLLNRTYDIDYPEVVAIHLTGAPRPGVGPQDVAIAIIGAVFEKGLVKNKVLEFIGDGIANLPMDYRCGIDVMTTETTCLSSIWMTDGAVENYFKIHKRPEAYAPLAPKNGAYYDSALEIDLSGIECMIALPFHPSNAYTVKEVCANAGDVLRSVEKAAAEQLELTAPFTLTDKITPAGIRVDQGVIAGCAGGTFDNLCAAAKILAGGTIGDGAFALSAYPASQPVYMELIKNGAAADLMGAGVTLRTAFCGPCFGAGDVPANGGLSIRHSTRNFPNREGSKPNGGQIASVALMDARSIAATARNGGILTPATDIDFDDTPCTYTYDDSAYTSRVYNGWGKADPSSELKFGPNIADWPKMAPLTDDLLLQVASVITDPVTTTDELIPSGETSSYRSNPEKLSSFALSRKDPGYVDRAKAVRILETARREGKGTPDLADLFARLADCGGDPASAGIGTVVCARRPGDGSAREQAASCQKVLGGWANLATEYATKRYRSNLINWGMLPLTCTEDIADFAIGDWLYLPAVRRAVEEKWDVIEGFVVSGDAIRPIKLTMGSLTDDERAILLDGCLINHCRV